MNQEPEKTPVQVSGRELEVILDSTHDGMIAVDAEGTVTIFNKAAERITGLRAADIRGRPAVETIPNTRLHVVLSTETPELSRTQTLGTTTIITNRMPVFGQDGKVCGAVAVFRDVTELQHLTEQVCDLWNARALLQAVIEATEDAISVADENGNNIIVNPAYTRITGLSKDAVIGKPATVDIAEGESMHMKVLRTGKPVRNQRMKVGPMRRDVVVNVAPIIVEGRVTGSVGVIHDISEIMRLIDELSRTRTLLRRLKARYTLEDIIGISPALAAAKEQALRAADTPATVLLLGESGIGKELFAHAIHNASNRSSGQFVRVNCAAIAESLLESQLFGYEEGAFTGAVKGGRKGLFEEAQGGTVFLDEVGEVGISLQSKLLRVLQEKEILRVGGTNPVRVDVRVIAATNADLEQKVRSGGFREDLFYRLNVIPINIPPLRQRPQDIPPLVEHLITRLNQEFNRQVTSVTPECMEVLTLYIWPGNVRELENVLGRAIINMRPQETVITAEHLPPLEYETVVADNNLEASTPAEPLDDTMARAEKAAIENALRANGGNRTRTARVLGISARSLYYKMKRHQIE